MDVERAFEDLRSPDFEVAVEAAERLRHADGDAVTRALAEALDAHDTAIVEVAAASLIRRNAPHTAELMWDALVTLEDDATTHIWDAVEALPGEPVSRELIRRSHEG